MKLSEGEQKVSEYFFRAHGDVGHMAVLTNKRLVIVWANAEESYPLSKITAVKHIFNRRMGALVAGVVFILIGFGVFGDSTGAGLFCLAIGAALAWWGWLGKTQLLISQMGGEKFYSLRGKAPRLMDFIESVNATMS
jgi:hypothetical protein